MSWFILSLICMLGWGFADLFYKLGTDETDFLSHLKIAVWVGLVMGVCACGLIPFSEGFGGGALKGFVKYLPASLSYIVSMVIGYAGLRYLEMSIVSPVQNASGALSAICMLMWFSVRGGGGEGFTLLDMGGTALIVLGVILLAVVENRLNDIDEADKKYRLGAKALLFPLLYCVFDTLGTAADGIILDESSGLNLGEIDVLILYGFTFLLAGGAAWIYMLIKTRHAYNPFAKGELKKGAAALCEEAGQIFYVYAMAARPVLAAPMVASYCVVSVALSAIFAGERLKKAQYACVFLVVWGIIALGISEGLGEL